ncbi:hypothetical protein [Streptomyces anthocyanicus]
MTALAAAIHHRIEQQAAKPKTPNPLRINVARDLAEVRKSNTPKEPHRG